MCSLLFADVNLLSQCKMRLHSQWPFAMSNVFFFYENVSLLREMVDDVSPLICLSTGCFVMSRVSNRLGNWLAVGTMFAIWVVAVPATAAATTTGWPSIAAAIHRTNRSKGRAWELKSGKERKEKTKTIKNWLIDVSYTDRAVASRVERGTYVL